MKLIEVSKSLVVYVTLVKSLCLDFDPAVTSWSIGKGVSEVCSFLEGETLLGDKV